MSAPRAIFYVGARDRSRFLLRFLKERVLDCGRTARIFAAPEEGKRLDDFLWTAEPDGFIPHSLAGEYGDEGDGGDGDGDDDAPIVIAEAGAQKPPGKADVWILWEESAPPQDCEGCGHIVVIAAPGGGWQRLREHFADRGCEINIHKVGR